MPLVPQFINIDGAAGTLNTSNLEDIADKVFYGARQDISTGKTYIDIIAGGTAINLADDSYSSRPDDYLNWMWSSNTLRFSVDANGHILMEVY